MSDNGATPKLAAALVAAQAEFPPVEKTAKANYGMYTTLDHLIAKTRPILNKHGLAITQEPTITEMGAPALSTTLLHVSGEQRSSVMLLILARQDMQQLGGAITYAKRYAWSAALGISTDEDDDGQQTVKAPPAPVEEWDGTFPPPDEVVLPEVAVIPEGKRRLLRKLQKDSGVSDERLKELVFEVAGVESSKLIPVARFDALCAAVKDEPPTFEAMAAAAQAKRDAL